jgi:predicted nucleic acid-binding protein
VAWLVDTSVLARLANRGDANYSVADRAVVKLHRHGETLHVAPQNLIEFRNVATRPVTANGLGLTGPAAEAKSLVFEAAFPLLEETPWIYPEWKSLVATLGVVGKQVHDARLVAICQVHAIDHVLTFHVSHFLRLASGVPGLTIVDPEQV